MPTLPIVTWSRGGRGVSAGITGLVGPSLSSSYQGGHFKKLICTANFATHFFNKYQGKDVLQLPYHFVFISEHHDNYPTHLLSSSIFRELLCRCLGVYKAC